MREEELRTGLAKHIVFVSTPFLWFPQPKKKVSLSDILEGQVADKYFLSEQLSKKLFEGSARTARDRKLHTLGRSEAETTKTEPTLSSSNTTPKAELVADSAESLKE